MAIISEIKDVQKEDFVNWEWKFIQILPKIYELLFIPKII